MHLIDGVQGQSAWICVTEPKRITVEVWNDHSIGATTLMRLVGGARL